jgi:hypothetical protein
MQRDAAGRNHAAPPPAADSFAAHQHLSNRAPPAFKRPIAR